MLKQSQIRSPLDSIGSGGAVASNGKTEVSVGRMRLHVSPCELVDGIRCATASVVICGEVDDVVLSGIVLRESRPGWVAMDVPAEEAWSAVIAGLPKVQRDRILSPAFLERLRGLLGERFVSGR